MAISIKRLRKFQIGQEVTEGTEVAATAVFLPTGNPVFSPDHVVAYPDETLGLVVRRSQGVLAQRKYTFEIPFQLTYEQILYPLNNTMVALLTGTGAGADKTYTFLPSPTAANAPKPFTMEARYSDGTNNDDATYVGCMGTELEISPDMTGFTNGTWRGYARSKNTNALTAALTAPATLTMPAGLDWQIRVDGTWAALGTTQKTGQLQGFTWHYTSGLAPKWYMDNSKDPARSRRNERVTTLQLKLDKEALGTGMAADFLAKWESRAASFITLRALGPVVGAGNYKLDLDGIYYVDKVSGVDENDGEDAVTVDLTAAYDPTGAQDVRVTVVNASATLT